MNRNQAEHILDAYKIIWARSGADEAAGALREVILDAMTSNSVTTPTITWPNTWPNTTTTYKPIVTCDTGGTE